MDLRAHLIMRKRTSRPETDLKCFRSPDKYEIIRLVGRGASGMAHLVRRRSDDCHFIMKQIPVEQMTLEERQSALNEVKVLAMLNHPNIVRYFENFIEEKALMIVMEFAEGGTLAEYLQTRLSVPLSESEVMFYFVQLVLALQHVHSKQILHRDLKCQNILLDRTRLLIKLSDFGISKVLLSRSKAYSVVGTPSYISPELCQGKPYDHRGDVWSLGCILYELCTLRKAFEAGSLPALVLKITRGLFTPLSSERYSRQLRALTVAMLSVDPEQRPSISDLLSHPLLIPYQFRLFCDIGAAPQIAPPTYLQSRARIRHSPSSSSTKALIWGGGQESPSILCLPNHVDIEQATLTETNVFAVTSSGLLMMWRIDGRDVPPDPHRVSGLNGVLLRQVATSNRHCFGVTDQGLLMCLDMKVEPDEGISAAPSIVDSLLGAEIVRLRGGESHFLALASSNTVFGWGDGRDGRLGMELAFTRDPMPVIIDLLPQETVVGVECGLNASAILLSSGRVLMSGDNSHGKLGRNPDDAPFLQSFQTVTFTRSQPQIVALSLGWNHSALLDSEGRVWTAGSNKYGQLGRQETESSQNAQGDALEEEKGELCETRRTFARVEGGGVEGVACGDAWTACWKGLEIITWGKKERGRLGREESSDKILAPRCVKEILIRGCVGLAIIGSEQ